MADGGELGLGNYFWAKYGHQILAYDKTQYLYRMVNVLERWVLYKMARDFFLVNG